MRPAPLLLCAACGLLASAAANAVSCKQALDQLDADWAEQKHCVNVPPAELASCRCQLSVARDAECVKSHCKGVVPCQRTDAARVALAQLCPAGRAAAGLLAAAAAFAAAA
eukprot:TRINITY_DN615_c1_g1_i2.p4 TRINITY_DN615_c1_g1~~TRINITY_DN615_c1_g1_i2.p4  ORF type:complete len:111 (+),score=38.51 TRINITY_DN615_c1_g1_i2:65-397(+)